MDDTQASIKTTEAAAATRKRRSSILKSQRPPRTPFSELEFNVATPTDTAKSRRVSFSRRTGVAEFVTNEATTTWKNFYEEHNKSLESSGNESAANAPRPVIGHIGKRIFDQQFEEVEVVDIGGALQSNTAAQQFQSSFNNVNLTQQLMAFELDCIGDDKRLTVPVQNFELSNLTEHNSKVFGNELSVPITSDMSNPISMNFSNVQPLGKCDDLEEIARDLERPHAHVMCPGPFSSKDVSEYIEVDFNMTNVVVRNEDCDMSITDTVHSPKVQALSKQSSIRETKLNQDVDKENIIMNPYVTPKETANFAINDEFDRVLVFDGKKLTMQSERQPIDGFKKQELPIVPIAAESVPKRKTIVLNVNDDLPNFISDSSSLMSKQISADDIKKSVIYNDCDLSITQAVGTKIDLPKRNTIVFDDDMGNLSVTQALPAKIITNKEEKRKTIIYENETADISITQAVSVNKFVEKKSFIYEEDLSFTQALPANLILNKTSQNKTIYYQDGLDISVTKPIPGNNIILKGDTETKNHISNISMTLAIPSNIIINENADKSMASGYKDDVDINKGLENNVMPNKDKRKTIVYDNEGGNISLTQAIPANILLENDVRIGETGNIDLEKTLNKRKTIIYDNEQGDISMTQAMPSNIIATKTDEQEILLNNMNIKSTDKRKTIIYDKEEGNVSMTQVMPPNILQTVGLDAIKNIEEPNEKTNKRKTIIYNNEDADISMTQAIPANIIQAPVIKDIDNNVEQSEVNSGTIKTNKRQTIVYNDEDGEVSMTQGMPTNIIQLEPREEEILETNSNRRRTVIYDSEEADISITQAIPSNIMHTITINKVDDNEADVNMASNKRQTVIYDNNEGDVSMNPGASSNIKQTKAETNKIEMLLDEIDVNISAPRKLHTDIIVTEHNIEDKSMNATNIHKQNEIISNHPTSKLNTFEESEYNVNNNMSITKPIPAEIMSIQNDILKKNDIDTDKSLFAAELDADVHQRIVVYQTTEKNGIEQKPDQKQDDHENFIESEISNIISLNSKENDDANCEYDEYDVTNDVIIKQKSELKSNFNVDVKKNKKSILSDLLDMSNASLVDEKSEDHIKEGPFKVTIDDVNIQINSISNSNNSVVVRDSENEIKKQNENVENIDDSNVVRDEFIASEEIVKNMGDVDRDDKREIGNELANPDVSEDCQKSNRHFEKMISSDLINRENLDESNFKSNNSVVVDIKRMRDADNTKDLFDMLSDLTDGRTGEKNDRSIVANAKNLVSGNEPKRLSFMPKRQSIAISREDLLNNISMAQAALQLSRSYNDSDNIEDTQDSPEDMVPSPDENCVKTPNKSVRMSTEVVKTLHFDESVSDVSMTTDMNTTPLKKTTFGETTFMGEDKAKVIPSYLKDVSDGIKSLMVDLVKPTADISLNDRPVKKPPSTCSTQIQANLITSSQIEIDTEFASNSESAEYVQPMESLVSEVAAVGQRAVTHALRQSFKSDVSMEVEQELKPILKRETPSPPRIVRKSAPSPVIMFDHLNPLNNILLTQMDCSKVHTYNPLKEDSNEEIVREHERNDNQIEIERLSTYYDIDKRKSYCQSELHARDGIEKIDELNIVLSNASKPLSIDRSTEGLATELKHTEINTVIAMKDNKHLLDTISSLTLVDDALDQPLDIDMEDLNTTKKSPLKVIYKVEEDLLKDSDLTSNDEYESTKPRKRSYSPTRQDKKMSQVVDITPKPVSKMQKISLSPKMPELAAKISEPPKVSPKSSPDKKMSPKKKNSVKHDVTVHHLIADCYNDAGADPKTDRIQLKSSESSSVETLEVETMSKTFQSIKSNTTFTSSKNVLPPSILENRVSDQRTVVSSNPSSVSEFSSYTNIVSKIQMLSFMGSKDCEWETCNKDMWSFLLLRSRVRLTVQFARNYETPITSLTVDPVNEKEKEPSSTLCIRLAAEAMRYECAQCALLGTDMDANGKMGADVKMEGTGVTAQAMPNLLRRCVEVSRLALLWARVMRDARLRLAYTVTRSGDLAFKVVNFPLRTVWEVHLRIELVVDDAQHLACPRARLVRVVPVLEGAGGVGAVGGVGGVRGSLDTLLENVRKDWGHAPAALWKIFRYLKNKAKDEDLCLQCFKT